ncbi:hypothetical protein [Bacteroides sp.]|uniref:hypothetical protein n=1 Tax=Bacteroides sp. TaxID=29523 RepID=UPI002602C1B8|nr:hypothetical protein [Bacteroides sp.]MDD3037160.1 hypothetical protein [Bacteroides sp.]
MIGSIIGGALNVGGAIAGGIIGARSARKQARMIADEKSKNQAWFDRRYNEDSTQRADAQAAIAKMREAMKERTAAAAGRAAVMGGTEESIAIEKEAQNKALADTMSKIAINGEARKDAIEAQYQARDAELMQLQLGDEQRKANNISSATGGISSVGAGIMSSIFPDKQ